MRWIFRLIGIAIVTAALAIGALVMLPGDRIAQIAVDQMRAQTGRDLVIEGGVSVRLWPVLGVTTGPVELANAGWAGAEPMFQAKSVAVGVDAAALLRGDIRVTRMAADAPVLRLQRHADGRANWHFTGQTGDSGSTERVPLTLDQVRISDAHLIWVDGDAAPVALRDVDLALKWPDATQPMNIEATLRPAGDPVLVSANIDRVIDFLDGAIVPLTAQVENTGGKATLVGRASRFGEAAGQVRLHAGNTARFLAALGVSGGDVPRGLGQAADVSAEMTLTQDGRLSLRELVANLDGNALRGAADIGFGAPMQVTANLSGGVLDLSGLVGTDSGASGQGWSDAAIDADGLALMNGAITLAVAALDLGQVQTGPARMVLSVDRSRAVLQLAEVAAYGGTVSGQLVANNRNGLSVGAKLRATGVALDRVSRDLAGASWVAGAADGSIELLGVGETMAQIMATLRGGGSFEMPRGSLEGFDLDRLLRRGEAGGGSTVFTDLTGTFTITDGNLQNDNLAALLPVGSVTGAGRIGLGVQDMDYVVTPTVQLHRDGTPRKVAVRIDGPWDALRLRPDMDGVMQGRLEGTKDNLRAAARDKLAEELNVSATEGDDLSDVARVKLIEELGLADDPATRGRLRDGIRRLLDGE